MPPCARPLATALLASAIGVRTADAQQHAFTPHRGSGVRVTARGLIDPSVPG